jgi:hypothetical protein
MDLLKYFKKTPKVQHTLIPERETRDDEPYFCAYNDVSNWRETPKKCCKEQCTMCASGYGMPEHSNWRP